jgi:hypoxia up-regulated 1
MTCWKRHKSFHNLLLVVSFFTIYFVSYADAILAAMSIDLGSQFVKIGIVKPGVPMEIVLNRESRRKTPTVVSIRGKERSFSDQGAHLAVRYPKTGYTYFPDLVGKTPDHPLVQLFQSRFPHFDIRPHKERGMVTFFENEETSYTIEEILGMLLQECKAVAEKFAEQSVKDAVITVPPYYNQAERRALFAAAKIAGLNVLQLMNDNTAAGVNYGMFRRKQFNETATRVLIYDMGASKSTATVLEYSLVKDKMSRDKDPEMRVLGVGYDRTLGGLEMTLRLRDYLAAEFDKLGKAKKPVTSNARAMAKLLKEAERVKQVLTVNADHFAQIEGLFEDQDFRHKVSRDKLEELNSDLWTRIGPPVDVALRMAEISLDQIDTVILMGGGTRMPKVQEKLQAALKGMTLGKYLNQDEAITLGAVYQAAHLSKGFKVKKFMIKEANLFPVRVNFMKENSSTEDQPEGHRVTRSLFGLRNPYPQRKVMTFSKHTADFDIALNYDSNDFLTAAQKSYITSWNQSVASVGGVGNAIHANTEGDAEYKGVKVHFRMDESGVMNLDSAEALFEKPPKADAAGDAKEPSTLSKIGSKISNLFSAGSGTKDDANGDDGSATENKAGKAEKGEPQPPSSRPPGEESENGKQGTTNGSGEQKATGSGDKKSNTTKDKGKNASGKSDSNSSSAKAGTNGGKSSGSGKPVLVKEKLTVTTRLMDSANLTTEEFKESMKRLRAFEVYEKEKAEREEASNALESFLFDMQDKLEQDDYKSLTTDAERESYQNQIKEVKDWFEEQGLETVTKEFKERLKTLKDVMKDLFYKLEEARERPRVIEAIANMLNYSTSFLNGVKNLTEDQQMFTEKEIEALEKLINSTADWWGQKQLEQSNQPSHEKPVITINAVAEKLNVLDREVKYLLNKAKFATPLKAKKAAEEKAAAAAAAAAAKNATSGNETVTGTGAKKTTSETNQTKKDIEIPAAGAPSVDSDDASATVATQTTTANESTDTDSAGAETDSQKPPEGGETDTAHRESEEAGVESHEEL